MKFDCGEEWEEKKARLKNWHDFFAIFPRKVAPHDCRWMETIQRRAEWYDECAEPGFIFEYRAK